MLGSERESALFITTLSFFIYTRLFFQLFSTISLLSQEDLSLPLRQASPKMLSSKGLSNPLFPPRLPAPKGDSGRTSSTTVAWDASTRRSLGTTSKPVWDVWIGDSRQTRWNDQPPLVDGWTVQRKNPQPPWKHLFGRTVWRKSPLHVCPSYGTSL